MSFITIFLIAISMAVDAFTVCLGVGTSGNSGFRPAFRLSFHFGFFQFLMPIVGWFSGKTIAPLISGYDHWVAFGLLAFVGIRMIRSGLGAVEQKQNRDPSRGVTLVLLSIAVSIDALAVGLSLAFLGMAIWYPAIVIGIVTGLLSWFGLRLGNSFNIRYGKKVEVAGGVLLLLIGLQTLFVHLFA